LREVLQFVGRHVKKVVVLGIDGMDRESSSRPSSIRADAELQSLDGGRRLPPRDHHAPAKPVAWSTFMTGPDSGGHGIFDFIHVDPTKMAPHNSMAVAEAGGRPVNVGLVVPRPWRRCAAPAQGQNLWQMLGEHGLRSTIFRMPVNFPPVKAPGRSLSGMGTPDLIGSQGTFSFYTDHRKDWPAQISGGEITR
jgi:predicted AlkP superfamily phosphohydrolase/phosphomutase